MKRFVLLFSTVLIALTSCDNETAPEYDPMQPKFVDKITNVNGSEISLEYDSDMRVKGVTYIDALDASKNRNYEIKYNLNMTNNNVTFDIISGDKKYIMKFNEYGALSQFVLDGAPQKVLSTFNYNSYNSIGAFHLELQGMIDNLTGGETRRIDWSYGTPINQINQRDQSIEGTTYTYSTSIQYSYMKYRSNVHANVNFFNLMVPEFLEYSNIPTELAATVSVFGTRSTYLPTDITVIKGRSMAGENYTKLSEEEREYTYDTNDNGYITKIYTGKDDNETKKLLYTIKYVGEDDEDKK
jgi:hypothetical protein